MHATRLVWTESAEDRLTGGYPGNRMVARAAAAVMFVVIWLCCVVIALLVPEPVLSHVLAAVVSLGFVLGGVALAAFGGRGGQRRWIARLQIDRPHAVLIACIPVDGMTRAVRRLARVTGGIGRPSLLIAGFVLAAEAERISFLSKRRSMVFPTATLDRIRRGTATIPSGYNGPLITRSTIDLSFSVADGEAIVVQLCPIPINEEPRHFFRPAELGIIAETLDRAIRGARIDGTEM